MAGQLAPRPSSRRWVRLRRVVVGKPSKIGKYDVIDVLGRGGMGVVYKATDPHFNRLVAIKMMTGGFSDNPDLLNGSTAKPNLRAICSTPTSSRFTTWATWMALPTW